MIVRLRRKLTLLVIAVLATVTAGIIFSISYANYRSVDRQAYNALRVMTRVVIPMSVPGIVSGVTMVFMPPPRPRTSRAGRAPGIPSRAT